MGLSSTGDLRGVPIELRRLPEVAILDLVELFNHPDALRRAFEEMGLASVIVPLPPSRKRIRALFRLGFRPDGSIEVGGERFLGYRLLGPRAG